MENVLLINEIRKKHYTIKHEYHDQIDYGIQEPLLMKTAYSLNGDYIGNSRLAHRFVKNYGITEFEKTSKNHSVCSIGYSPKKGKWFGWSHRAIYGFKVGSKTKKGDCSFLPKNKTEFKEDLLRFWSDKKLHKETTARFATIDGIKGVEVSWQYNDKAKNKNVHHTICSHFTEYPDKWGRGEWTAKNMKEAKRMAIDFAEGVS